MHERRRYRTVHDTPAETETLRAVLDAAGWRPTRDDRWDLLWSHEIATRDVYRRLRPEQLINHLPGIDPMILKDSLHDHLALHYEAGPRTDRTWAFPRTFALDGDLGRARALAVEEPDTVWIAKPRDGAMGRGIHLVATPDDAAAVPGLVIQEYMDDPLVFPEHPGKHVLRVYVLVKGLDPPEAFIHPECTVKVASRPYRSARTSLDDLVVHLTNPTVQMANTDVADPVRAIDIDAYAARLRSVGHDPGILRDRLRELAIDLVAAFQEPVATLSGVYTSSLDSCFELLGLDVLVDAQLRPWLLECNLSPSLRARSAPDTEAGRAQRRAKHAVIADTLALVGAVGGPDAGQRGRFEPLF